jgi:hypothetical protein
VTVSVEKEGVVVTPIVEVPVKTMLLPARRYETGVLKKEFQFVDDAVSGTE